MKINPCFSPKSGSLTPDLEGAPCSVCHECREISPCAAPPEATSGRKEDAVSKP